MWVVKKHRRQFVLGSLALFTGSTHGFKFWQRLYVPQKVIFTVTIQTPRRMTFGEYFVESSSWENRELLYPLFSSFSEDGKLLNFVEIMEDYACKHIFTFASIEDYQMWYEALRENQLINDQLKLAKGYKTNIEIAFV